MSRTLSTNSGSLDSLNVSERCGCRPKAAQIRRIVVWEKPVSAGHRTDRPVRRVDRRGAQRPLDHRSDLIVVDRSWSAGSSLVQQTIKATLQEAPTPLANRVFVDAQLGRDDLAGQAVSTSQNDPAPLGHRPCNPVSAHLPLKILPLLRTQHQRCRWTACRIRHDCALQPMEQAYIMY